MCHEAREAPGWPCPGHRLPKEQPGPKCWQAQSYKHVMTRPMSAASACLPQHACTLRRWCAAPSPARATITAWVLRRRLRPSSRCTQEGRLAAIFHLEFCSVVTVVVVPRRHRDHAQTVLHPSGMLDNMRRRLNHPPSTWAPGTRARASSSSLSPSSAAATCWAFWPPSELAPPSGGPCGLLLAAAMFVRST